MQGRLTDFRSILKKKKLAGFVVPSGDEFQSEFCPAHARRLEWLTWFSGSAGVAVILEKKAAFFTDGRYMLQAKNEIGKGFELFNIADKKPWEWAKENIKNGKLGLDPWLHSEANAKQYMGAVDVAFSDENLVDLIWKDRPSSPADVIKTHPLKYAGQKLEDKVNFIVAKLKEKKADACILASPDSVCWLLNIRGNDIPTTPFVLSFAIVYQNGTVKLFISENRLSPAIMSHFGTVVKIVSRETLIKEVKSLNKSRILLDPSTAPYVFFDLLKKAEIIRAADPCQLPKACKNKVEIKGAIEAHIADGAALTRFLHWLNLEVGVNRVSEVSAARKLLNFRRENKEFKTVSFDTIAGFGANGAIVHYRPINETDKEIKGNGLLLLDSGGQYSGGTTDVTRTLAIGSPTKEQKRNFTLVLKGHIALATAVFPVGTTGTQLDIMARQYLWQNGLDYDHGTGHGVGSFLSVHEGPQRISKVSSNVALQQGMIISNEPGFYKEGEYGIRIENLVLVVEKAELSKNGRKFLGFETITKVPLDLRLVDDSLLTDDERKWLVQYHKDVLKDLSLELGKEVKEWLKVNITG